MNSLKGLFLEFHILQSFPCTCLNRDDMNMPKNAIVGGVERARVSSQCWKRAVRLAMRDFCGVEIGLRTKMVSKLIIEACMKRGATNEQAEVFAEKISKAFVSEKKASNAQKKPKNKKNDASGSDQAEVVETPEAVEDSKSDAIVFLSKKEIDAIAAKFEESNFDITSAFLKKDDSGDGKKEKKPKELSEEAFIKSAIEKNAIDDSLDGLDIALYGRMVAQSPDLDVNAASSFAHAISTHAVARESDYFTAVADIGQNKGACHLGTNSYNSATYYRYISVDIGQLYENLAGTNIEKAIEAFTKALFLAVPSARQSTFAGHCPWDFARVLLRRGQPMQLSFEKPVESNGNGFSEPSIKALNENIDKSKKMFGSCYGEKMDRSFGIDENYSVDSLISDIIEAVHKETPYV